jgi:hypothetical protein
MALIRRHSIKTAILFSLPCVFILIVGTVVARWRENERNERIAYYSHPFAPRLQIERVKVPGYATPGLFEAQARCTSSGGSGQSQWVLRGVLVTSGRKSSPPIWNSQKLIDPTRISEVGRETSSISHTPSASPGTGPSSEASVSWRFDRNENADNLRLIVEAVAVPVAVMENKLGSHNIKATEATPSQISTARRQPGAKYFRESIELLARDDSKHHFTRDAMKS